MEGNSNSKPNEQSIANDWRSQHEPNLRNNVVSNLVKWLQRVRTDLSINQLKDFALEIEEEAYGIATDKGDYNRKISKRFLMLKREAIDFRSGSSVNETNYTLEPAVVAAAQVLNQGQQWLPPGFQNNPNVDASCFSQQQQAQQQPQNTTYMFQQQVNQTQQQQLRPPHMQQQTQQQFPSIQHRFPRFPAVSSSPTSGRINPQISALEICPSHQQKMAKFIQLKQEMEELAKDINQHNHSTSWQNNGEHQGSFMVSSSQQSDTAAASQALNQTHSLPTSQPWLPQEIQSNHNMFQHQMNQLHLNKTIHHWNFRPPHMPPQPIQQQFPHPTSHPSIQHPFDRFSAVSGQQNPPFFTRSQLQVCASSQRKIVAHSQEQKQGMAQQNMHQQYQPMMYQSQYPELLPPQKRSSQQHLECFQAASSLRQTQNRVDQQNQSYQRVNPENPSTSRDSAKETVNESGGEWQEETYQKIQVLKEKSLAFVSTYLQKYVDKLQEIDSLPQEKQKEIHEGIQSLKNNKSSLEQIIEFLNVDRSKVSKMHKEKLPKFEEQLLKWGGSFKTLQSLKPKQQKKQGRIRSSQTKMPPLQKRRKMKSKDENNIMVSSGNVVLPSLKQNPQVVPEENQQLQKLNDVRMRHGINIEAGLLQQHLSSSHVQLPTPLVSPDQQLQKPTSDETNEMNDVSMRQGNNIEADLLQQHLSTSDHQLPTSLLASPAQLLDHEILPELVNETGTPTQSGGIPISEWSIDNMIEAMVNEEITNSRDDTIANKIPGIFPSSEESRACLTQDLSNTRRRSLITLQTDDGYKHLESEGDSTASSWL